MKITWTKLLITYYCKTISKLRRVFAGCVPAHTPVQHARGLNLLRPFSAASTVGYPFLWRWDITTVNLRINVDTHTLSKSPKEVFLRTNKHIFTMYLLLLSGLVWKAKLSSIKIKPSSISIGGGKIRLCISDVRFRYLGKYLLTENLRPKWKSELVEKLTLDLIRYYCEAIHHEPQNWSALFKMFHIHIV